MKVKEISCKSCLTKSKLTDYVINPYVGCQHACRYCYAVFMKRFHDIREPWGDFVHVKINCPDLLPRELKKAKAGNIWLSSVTDAYMPLEKKYRLTRKILEVFSASPYKIKFTIEILTKSALIRRDFDLLADLDLRLGCSLNTLDPKTARMIEPTAAAPLERVKVLQEAKAVGLEVYGFISPVIPGLTNLEELFRELHFCDYVWVELLNTKTSVLQRLSPILQQHYPDTVSKLQFTLDHPEEYYEQICSEVNILKQIYNLRVQDIVRHDHS